MDIREADNMVIGIIEAESIDEYKSIRAYYDAAQKQIASTVDPIEAEYMLEISSDTELNLKKYIQDKHSKILFRVRKILGENSYTRVFGNTYNFPKGEYRVFCYVYPDTITDSTPVDYEFEVSLQAQAAIAYYAAAQCVVGESDQRPYYAFMDRYNNILLNINDTKKDNVSLNIVKLGDGINGI